MKSKIRRVNNIRHAYDYPAENNGWKKYGTPVLGGKTQGIYFDPYVREWDLTFVMFSSFRNGASIVRCESHDGIAWTKPVEVLKGTGAKDWENIVNRASVIQVKHVWYMWYTGQDQHSILQIDGLLGILFEITPVCNVEVNAENEDKGQC